MTTKSKTFRNMLVLSMLWLFVASQASAQGGAMQCDAKTLSFYPAASLEALLGAKTITFGLSSGPGATYSGTCNFALANDGNAFISALASEHGTRDAANLAFQSYKEGVKNPGEMSDGSCDRYINVKSANDSAAFQAQKGSYIFRVSASLKAKVSSDKLKAILDYACEQAPGTKVAGTDTGSTPETGATPAPMQASTNGKFALFGGLGLIILIIVIVSFLKRSRKPPVQ